MRSKLVTRQKIVETSAGLFLQHGISSVSMDRVARDARITKMTVYQHFETKEALLLQCLRWRLEKREEQLTEHFPANCSSSNQVLEVFDWMAQRTGKESFHGCAFLKATNEVGGTAPEVRAIAFEAKRVLRDRLIGMLERAEVPRAEEIGDAMSLLLEGAQALSLIEQSTRPFQAARREAEHLLASLRDVGSKHRESSPEN